MFSYLLIYSDGSHDIVCMNYLMRIFARFLLQQNWLNFRTFPCAFHVNQTQYLNLPVLAIRGPKFVV